MVCRLLYSSIGGVSFVGSCIARKDPGIKLATSPQLRKKSLPKPKRSEGVSFLPEADNEALRFTMSPERKNDLVLYEEGSDIVRAVILSVSSQLIISIVLSFFLGGCPVDVGVRDNHAVRK